MSDIDLDDAVPRDSDTPISEDALPASTGQPSILVPFHQLYHAPEQVRKVTVSAEKDAQLDASLIEHGLIHSLTTYQDEEDPNRYAVFAGGRRLRRHDALIKRGLLPDTVLIPITVRSRSEAVELSLVENVERESMHPADEFKAFHRLHKAGQTAATIAQRFGLTTLYVERVLQLARVHRTLFKAFRDDKLGLAGMTAYAFSDDTRSQKATFDALGPDAYAHAIRRALTDGLTLADSKIARYVGLSDYNEAGGATRADLFSEAVYLCDLELLQRLASEKLERAATRLTGWGWVETTLEYRSTYG